MSSELASIELSSPLTNHLNDLLDRLGLPFVLDTPLDLTPSLLLAILESLLQSRLPLSPSVRESRNDAAKVQAMKIFLGVLESDIINEDIGLSDIDPRRLAAGEWEEVVFVAKLLCWLGKQMDLLSSKHNSSTRSLRIAPSTVSGSAGNTGSFNELPRKASPSTRSTVTNSSLSFDRECQESDTTVQSMRSEPTETRRPEDERLLTRMDQKHRPQCIHEIEDPSFLAQVDDDDLLRAEYDSLTRDTDDTIDGYRDCSQDERTNSTFYSNDHSSSTVRFDGYIQEVDAGLELRSFEARKAKKRLPAFSTPEEVRDLYLCSRKMTNQDTDNPSNQYESEKPSIPRYPTETRPITRHTSPSQHALALLDERAKLLSKLASLDLDIVNTFSGRS